MRFLKLFLATAIVLPAQMSLAAPGADVNAEVKPDVKADTKSPADAVVEGFKKIGTTHNFINLAVATAKSPKDAEFLKQLLFVPDKNLPELRFEGSRMFLGDMPFAVDARKFDKGELSYRGRVFHYDDKKDLETNAINLIRAFFPEGFKSVQNHRRFLLMSQVYADGGCSGSDYKTSCAFDKHHGDKQLAVLILANAAGLSPIANLTALRGAALGAEMISEFGNSAGDAPVVDCKHNSVGNSAKSVQLDTVRSETAYPAYRAKITVNGVTATRMITYSADGQTITTKDAATGATAEVTPESDHLLLTALNVPDACGKLTDKISAMNALMASLLGSSNSGATMRAPAAATK